MSAGCVGVHTWACALLGWIASPLGYFWGQWIHIHVAGFRKRGVNVPINMNNCHGRVFHWCLWFWDFSVIYSAHSVFFSLVYTSSWVDAFSTNSPVYQPDVTNEGNGDSVQCHGARPESLPLTPWSTHQHPGCVCEGSFLQLEGRLLTCAFSFYYHTPAAGAASPLLWWKGIKLGLLEYSPCSYSISQNWHLGSLA